MMVKEQCEAQEYLKTLNLPEARLKFALKTKMTRTVQMNFKGDKKFALNKWQCNNCLLPDTQEHIVRCPTFEHLRLGKDLKCDKDLVLYFQKVIQIRENVEKKNLH